MNAVVASQASGVVNFATGTVTGDGTDIVVNLGFTPRHVEVVNVTDVEVWKKFQAMTAAQAVKVVTAGTTTIDTGSAIVLNERGFTLANAEFGSADVIHWAAWG